MVRKIPKRLREISLHDLLFVALPSLLLLLAGFWVAAQFIRPAPPRQIIFSSGGEGGAYQSFAARYKDYLARYDIELVEKPSAGSMENLQHLRDEKYPVDAAFIQGGTGRSDDSGALVSLGGLFHEPLWIFYRAGLAQDMPDGELDRLSQLKGRRLAIGPQGSGTHKLAMELLEANGIQGAPTQLVASGGLSMVEALRQGKVDAVFAVGPTQSAMVWLLLYTDGVRLMSLSHAEAYARRFPHLTKLTLPRGGVDLVRDIPPHDVTLVSPLATLVVREDIHPALVDLLLQAASEIHGESGLFQKAGEFPRPTQLDFPLSSEAERYYKSGKPLLQRYLPFWAATLIDRLVVMLVPLFALMIPIVKFAPALYGWRVRSRIFRRYGELKLIEAEVDLEPQQHSRAEWLARLDRIETDVNRMQTPLPFTDLLYNLRGHIGLVREAIQRKV
ncbi:MAG: TAXI family TRAP transporter solute-binding subunit [Sterolibacterium sp.]